MNSWLNILEAKFVSTKAQNVIDVINQIPLERRNMVKEVTLDMAGNMNLIAKKCFPKTDIVTDRFHVQKLASEAVQEERIRLRWEIIDQENKAIAEVQKTDKPYQPELLSNGDTHRQLLARSRYLLFKSKTKWALSQTERAEILFQLYPTIQKAYIAKKCFPKTDIVTDRFHVQKLASEAVQEERIRLRWEIIDQENKAIAEVQKTDKPYQPELLSNGDTHRQLLARSRYLLFKSKTKWTLSQIERAEILFQLYPTIQKAYNLAQELTNIFETNTDQNVARLKLAHWYDKVEKSEFKSFNTIARSIQIHYEQILNYFNNRSTNASAESFNAKIKEFRAQFRGVRDIKFFLYRLTKLYA